MNDFTTKKELTLAGLGWGMMPEHLIETELTTGQLIPINVEGIPVRSSVTLCMFRSRNHRKGPISNQFWNELKETFTLPE